MILFGLKLKQESLVDNIYVSIKETLKENLFTLIKRLKKKKCT